MADSALSTDPLEHYGAIERAYCEERWSAVIHDAQALIADLERAAEASPEGLKERLQLLIGHSFLYGLGDRDSAEDHYQAVLHSGAEVSLRQIAEQGLQQCALPVAPAGSPQEEEQQQDSPADPLSSLDGGTSGWPEAAAVASPAEFTIGSRADAAPAAQDESALLQGLQDSWGSEAVSLPSEEASRPSDESSALSWLTVEPKGAPQAQDRAALPVMPWLETTDAVEAAAPALPPEQAIHAEDLPLRQEDQARMPLMAAFAEVAAVPAVPIVLPPADRLDSQAVSAAFPDPALDSSEGLDASPSSPPESTPQERLAADVVEEPELIELYQAEAPALGEPLAQPVADPSLPSTQAQADIQASLPAEPGPPGGIERRGTWDSAPGEVMDRRAEPVPDPVEVPAPLPASSPVPVASVIRPFSAPPEPVAEEEPELLMGLLKVEMG
jgi:hypothetical protein